MYKWLLFLTLIASTTLQSAPSKDETLRDEDAYKLVIVMEQIKHLYVKDMNYTNIVENAIRGMLSNMDPYSEYLDEKALKMLSNSSSGEFIGVGIEITKEKGEVKIITPMAGSPAEKAGILPGDYITHVDGKRIYNEDLRDIVSLISGKEGTYVNIAVVTPNTKDIRELKIMRKKINYSSVKSELIDNFLYIKISSFSEKTDQDVKKVLRAHKKTGLSGVIVDVRNNPGGLLQSAAKTTDIFLNSEILDNKMIVYTDGKSPYSKLEMNATSGDFTNNLPMIVITNEGSASASEIFAGALKDHNRAIIVGRKTFGKGSVQTVLPITDSTAIKLTTALYYTPAGNVIQGTGVTPDIFVPFKQVSHDDEVDPSKIQRLLSEKNFKHSITPPANTKNESKSTQLNLFQKYANEDFPLYQSIIVLRGLNANNS